MSLGINASMRSHIVKMAVMTWEAQRQSYGNPVVNVRRKGTSTAPYLQHTTPTLVMSNVPVLPQAIKFVDASGKVIIDSGMYFIYISDVGIKLHDIIEWNGTTYQVKNLDQDINTNLTKSETVLVGVGGDLHY